jgi:CDP-paratose 2-epimerase
MRYLITGGAGFIGSNTADRLLAAGHEVILLDNLSRRGSEVNLAWLKAMHEGVLFLKEDVRDFAALKSAIGSIGAPDVVLHFAAQVAVTSSVTDPRTDFEINALGTLNLLEALRALELAPIVLYTSTNKVYGALSQLGVVEERGRYRYANMPKGVPETVQLDFYSPYGCSKGAADQYVRDYYRIYGIPTIVFRNSCIYGPRQFGIEDQGWLAWFVIAATLGKPITIYGDGKQVRDILYVDDLIDAMLLAITKWETTQGQVYNIGGGPGNSLAVWSEFQPILEGLMGREISAQFDDWRPGDQPVYISDISKARVDFGWVPIVSVDDGIARLYNWVQENRDLFVTFEESDSK